MSRNIEDNAGIHLIPCTSVEEQALLELTVEKGGLRESDLPDEDDSENNGHKHEFEALLEASPHSDHRNVQCWAIRESTWNQHSFSKGDLVLFFDNYQYNKAAIVMNVVFAPTLGEIILENKDEDSSREYFLIFEEVIPVLIDSNVMAEYAEDELDYIVSPDSLSVEHRKQIVKDFGSLEEFITKATSKRIGTIPANPVRNTVEFTENPPIQPIDPTEKENNSEESVHEQPFDLHDEKAETGLDSDSKSEDYISNTKQKEALESDDDLGEEVGGEPVQEDTTPDLDSKFPPEIKFATQSQPRPIAEEEIEQLLSTLHNEQLLILNGPKNTGKKETARHIANSFVKEDEKYEGKVSRVAADDRVVMTNFRKQLTYEEFVLGHTGSDTDRNPVTGVFGSICDLAAADTFQSQGDAHEGPPRYVLIIEDFHLVDAVSVFGNLWQLLYPGNRGREHRITLTGSDVRLWIPKGLTIIGLVDSNSPDSNLSSAVRRAFHIYDMTPNYGALASLYDIGDLNDTNIADSSFSNRSLFGLITLNKRIRKSSTLGPDYQLGERYLCDGDFVYWPLTDEELRDAWRYNIFQDLAVHYPGGLPELKDDLLGDMDIDHLSKFTIKDDDIVDEIVTKLAVDCFN